MPNNSEQFDKPPETTEELHAFRVQIRDQSSELYKQTGGYQSAPKVTCPCGRRGSILTACRCSHCGIWFCPKCQPRHFGPAPKGLLDG